MSDHERPRTSARQIRTKAFAWLAAAVQVACIVAALFLVTYIVLVLGEANPENGITQFIRSWADELALGFQDLFTPEGESVRVLVNYGIAAIFWLVVGSIAAHLIRLLG